MLKLILVTAFLFFAQFSFAQIPYQKSNAVYFNIETLANKIPYEKFTSNVFQLNDSTVYDLRYKKLRRRMFAVAYKKSEYESEGYATPKERLRFKTSFLRQDTVLLKDKDTEDAYYELQKVFEAKLIR
jgi:hypothetical protein